LQKARKTEWRIHTYNEINIADINADLKRHRGDADSPVIVPKLLFYLFPLVLRKTSVMPIDWDLGKLSVPEMSRA